MIPCKAHPLLHTLVSLLFPKRFLLSDSVPLYCDSIRTVESVRLDTEATHASETFPPHV